MQEQNFTSGRRMPEKNQRLPVWVSLLLLVVIGISATSCKSKKTADTESSAPITVATEPVSSYADVVSRVAPAVVTIRASRRVRAPQQFPFFNDPLFRQFFGDHGGAMPQQPSEAIQHALGSGSIVSADGYILTNHHVIDGAEEIKVDLADKRTYDAKLIGSDPRSDLAVLKLDVGSLPVLPMGNSDQVRVGDVALAIGNPLGVGQTVTMGIISAKGRSTGLSDGSFQDFLQTDAPINQGNSGGPLVNSNGEMIGINSQIISPSGGNIGIGFAIPANMARSVMDQLIKNGSVKRGKLGVTIQPVTADIASSLGLKEVKGALVNSVEKGSPAEKAGIQRGDVITAFNGSAVSDSNNLRNLVASTAPGTQVTITVWRDGKEQQFQMTVAELSTTQSKEEEQGGGDNSSGNRKFGMSIAPLTPDLASRLGISGDTKGVVVMNVDPAGAAAEAGLRQGDVIVEANHKPVLSANDLEAAAQQSSSRPVLLLVNRRGSTSFVTVTPRQ
jgi:Do/DeqQ family serine protease